MKRKQLLRDLESAIEQDRNGRPTPPEIAERMTKPVETPLYQVFVSSREMQILAVGPAIIKSVGEELVATINRLIAEGHERVWSNPTLIRVR